MKEANKVIVLYKGRVLGKGSFNELQKQGFLNKKGLIDNKADNSFAGEIEKESEDADTCDKTATLAKEYKSLQTSQEDRSIGVVSSKLYWDYFRSGMHPLAIFAVVCLCFIAQGRPPSIALMSRCHAMLYVLDTKNNDISAKPTNIRKC